MVHKQPTRLNNVFLHGGWRCGSTYLWSKFRELPNVTAFYEPFNERLANFTSEDIARDVTAAWDSRHPSLVEPYMAEYLPLLGKRGVPLFWDRFAVQRYFVGRDEPLFERDYLLSLLSHASRQSNHAVLGFSRSLGRLRAIKRQFRGTHVVLMRDPVQQWLSCRSYRIKSKSPYFELCHFLILALAPEGTLAARAAQMLKLPKPPAGTFKQQFKFMSNRFTRIDDELSYRVFLTVYVLSYLHALPEADLLLDIDQLGDPEVGEAASKAIAARTSLSVDFQDCSMPVHQTDCDLDFARVNDTVMSWLLAEDSRIAAESGAATATWCAVSEKLTHAPARVRRVPASASLGQQTDPSRATPLDRSIRFGKRLGLLFKSPWL